MPAHDGDIRVERLEDRLEPKVPFPHTHDFYHVLLIEKGSGTHTIDFRKHSIKARQLFVMKPGQIHAWTMNARGFVLEFTDRSLPRASRLTSTQDAFIFKSARDFDHVHAIFKLMEDECKRNATNADLALQGLLEALVVNILRCAGTVEISGNNDIVVAFRRLLEANYRTQHGVQFYATELGLSAKALTMRLTRLLGKSPRILIQDRCILEAKRLISHSQLPIHEIASRLGFDDPNYFSRFFKQATKQTPAQFRRA